jgi:hypothetical protein
MLSDTAGLPTVAAAALQELRRAHADKRECRAGALFGGLAPRGRGLVLVPIGESDQHTVRVENCPQTIRSYLDSGSCSAYFDHLDDAAYGLLISAPSPPGRRSGR